MRILHVSTRLILGGSQENTVLSCQGQAGLGHDVHLAYGPIHGPEGSMLERVDRFRTSDGRGITTHEVRDMVREVAPLRDKRCRAQLRDLIRSIQPDIVHTHSSKAGILGRLAAWDVLQRDKRPIGIVHTVHGPPFMPVEGGLLSRAKIRLVNWGYALAERHAAKRCHVIVSVADAMTEQFRARGIGSSHLFTTVRSGMEIEPFLEASTPASRERIRAVLGLSDDDFVIGTIARLAQHKGHDDLLDALGEDLKSHPNWKLLWVGDGWWRERLVARARSMGLIVRECDRDEPAEAAGAQIILTGLVAPGAVPDQIAPMDVLAHPSYREGLPRTVPQALLCGVPPVAYDVDGTREACIDGETGLLVPLGDRAGLRTAIERLANDSPGGRELRRALGRRGRELCRVAYAAETMVAELEKVYATALDRAGGSAGSSASADTSHGPAPRAE